MAYGTLRDGNARKAPRSARDRRVWPAILAFVLGTIAVGGVIGGLNVPGEWYRALAKPAWNPPDWVFGPVWTVLYGMVGYAGYRAWRAREVVGGALLGAWVVQLALNYLWTPLFFSARSLSLASVEIAFLLAAALGFMALAWGRDRVSCWLFVPYVAWVGFASVLTWTIWSMN